MCQWTSSYSRCYFWIVPKLQSFMSQITLNILSRLNSKLQFFERTVCPCQIDVKKNSFAVCVII